ncbi:MAG: hypothetical protein AAF146_06500 [Bacteroidota bacterium]
MDLKEGKLFIGPIAQLVRASDSSIITSQTTKAMKKKYCTVCNAELFGQKKMYCSNKCKQKHHYHRVKQQTNTYHSQTIRSLRRKLKLIDMMGGGCSKCAYSTNISALHFHHVDSTTKQFKLDARILSNRSWEAILQEVEKCVLLCANCHAEEHNPELSLLNVAKIIAGASGEKSSDEQGVNSGKPKFRSPSE